MKCPCCDSNEVDAEYVDVGVGSVRCTPYQCYACGASEIDWRHFAGATDEYYEGHVHTDPAPTQEELKRGWWKGQQSQVTQDAV